jgi:hypothetical protein
MYTLHALPDTRNTDVIVLRTLLLASAVWIFLSGTSAADWFRYAAALVLLLLALLARFLLMRTTAGYHKIVMLGALLLLAATRNLYHAPLFVLFASLPRFFYGDAQIRISDVGVALPGLIRRKQHAWSQLSNLILKDGLLTIDFVNNRLVQLPLDGSKNSVDEFAFNDFCRKQLSVHQNGNTG